MKVNLNLLFVKLFIYINIFSSLIVHKSFAEAPDEIEGVLIPNKGFNSVIPFATMFLSKKQPPVVKITAAQPTLLLFPFQMSDCWGNNNALLISDANIVKDSNGKPTNFSQVILNVKGDSIVNGAIPDQTAIVCKSVDNNAYPVGIEFVEENPYSIVKFLKKEEKYSLSLDQFGFDKGLKGSAETQNSNKDDVSFPKNRKIFEKIKEEKPQPIQNKMLEKPQDVKMESPKFVNKNLEKKNISYSNDESNNKKLENIKTSLQKIGVFANNGLKKDELKDDLQKNEKQKKMEELLSAAGIIAEGK